MSFSKFYWTLLSNKFVIYKINSVNGKFFNKEMLVPFNLSFYLSCFDKSLMVRFVNF